MTKRLDVRYRSDFLLDGKGDARSPLGAAAGLNKQEAALVDRIQERVARNLRAWKDGDIRPFARQDAQDLEAALFARGGLWVVLDDLQLTPFCEELDFLLDCTDSGPNASAELRAVSRFRLHLPLPGVPVAATRAFWRAVAAPLLGALAATPSPSAHSLRTVSRRCSPLAPLAAARSALTFPKTPA